MSLPLRIISVKEKVPSSGDGLTHDFKGNVTAHDPLASGGTELTYTWDAYDRMTKVEDATKDRAANEYDAGGRLLKRREDPDGDDDTTMNYWLGLNNIAEERWGAEAGKCKIVARPDDESGTDPTANGWNVHRSAGTETTVVYDDIDGYRGRVVHLTTDDVDPTDAEWVIGDFGDSDANPNDAPWADVDRRHLGLWMKNHGGWSAHFTSVSNSSWGMMTVEYR